MKLLILAGLILAGLILGSAYPVYGASAATAVQQAAKGETITVSATLPAATAVTVKLLPKSGQAPPAAQTVSPNGTTGFTFNVPSDLDFGLYTIEATQGDSKTLSGTPGSINVTAVRPQIDAVYPQVLFIPEQRDGFSVIGSGFSEDPKLYSLHFVSIESPIHCADNKGPSTPDETKTGCYTTKIDSEHRQLTFGDLGSLAALKYYAGRQKFLVVVDGAESNPREIVFSNSTPEAPREWALFLLAVLIVILVLLIRSGRKNLAHPGKDYFLQALFLDKQTQTYSLSQCQFYAWTGAAVLGYIYLATSKTLIQNSLTFPDIPAGLPGILLASAGTGVLAAGIANAKGDKGAGDVHPSLADFITTGGVVAAERLQFVVWTIIGVVTFVRLVFLSDPATIDDLPKIPDNFLQLMGISSAAYLGGKLARKAGPTLTDVSANPVGNNVLEMTLSGSGLAQSATFSIDDTPVPAANIHGIVDPTRPDVVHRDETNNEQGFATVLKFRIVNADSKWYGIDRKLTITNPDGQKAVWKFKVLIASVTLDRGTRLLTIKGAGFTAATTIACKIGGTLVNLPANVVIVTPPDTITATVPAAPVIPAAATEVAVTVTTGGDTQTFTVTLPAA